MGQTWVISETRNGSASPRNTKMKTEKGYTPKGKSGAMAGSKVMNTGHQKTTSTTLTSFHQNTTLHIEHHICYFCSSLLIQSPQRFPRCIPVYKCPFGVSHTFGLFSFRLSILSYCFTSYSNNLEEYLSSFPTIYLLPFNSIHSLLLYIILITLWAFYHLIISINPMK